MSRLPIVNFAKMERLLLKLGFERVRQKGVILFTATLMGELLPFPIILAGTWLAP